MSLPPIPDFENDPNLTNKQKSRRREYYAKREENILKTKAWSQDNKDNVREYSRKKKARNPEKYRAYARDYARMLRRDFPEKVKENKNSERSREAAHVRQNRIGQDYKKMAMEAYGGHCTCCGESRIEFLCLDHINNDGGQKRRSGEHRAGKELYIQLANAGYPDWGLQVLCLNCNGAKLFYGRCPHETEAAKLLGIILPKVPRIKRKRLTTEQKKPVRIKARYRRGMSEEKEREIAERYLRGGISMEKVGKEYGVSINIVHRAVHAITDKIVNVAAD